MEKYPSFDDVLIVPQFSEIKSRKDVILTSFVGGINLELPIISSNMDTVTGPAMANAMAKAGGVGALHRFMSIEDNVKMYKECDPKTIVSVGLGSVELERAKALFDAGAHTFLIDVAHGASMGVIEQVNNMIDLLGTSPSYLVGNFATAQSIRDFRHRLRNEWDVHAYKVGIGGGSACLTRVVTGCGMPTLASIIDCSSVGVPIIADGGCRNSGDIAKALAAGANTVMLGGMLAGTFETPPAQNTYKSIIIDINLTYNRDKKFDASFVEKEAERCLKGAEIKYRGSASTESYEVQGKVAAHRSYEGDAFLVAYKGPVANVLQQIEGGLRSALSYVGAENLCDFREYAKFIQVTQAGAKENGAHGKNS